MKRFFLLTITFAVLTIGSIASVSAQEAGTLTEQQVHACIEEAAAILEVTYAEAEAMYINGEIVLVEQGNRTAVKTTSGGGHTIAILENIF